MKYFLKGNLSGLPFLFPKDKKMNKTVSKLINKSVNDEKRLATFVVLEPQPDDLTTTDLHEDWYDADCIEKACFNFNKTCNRANLMHSVMTDGFCFVESYIAPVDMELGGVEIKKGTWLATIEVSDKEEHVWIWDGIKSGKFNGLSIQAKGIVEDIEGEED